jgi:excisionase family DNA binding protein
MSCQIGAVTSVRTLTMNSRLKTLPLCPFRPRAVGSLGCGVGRGESGLVALAKVIIASTHSHHHTRRSGARVAYGMLQRVRRDRVVIFPRANLASGLMEDHKAQREAPQEDRLLTVPEAARLLSVTKERVYEMARRQELPTVRVGKFVRVRPSALRAFVNRNERGAWHRTAQRQRSEAET